jgi:hypothetical protein
VGSANKPMNGLHMSYTLMQLHHDRNSASASLLRGCLIHGFAYYEYYALFVGRNYTFALLSIWNFVSDIARATEIEVFEKMGAG